MKNQFNRLVEIAYALKAKGQTGRAYHISGIFNKNKILSIGENNYNKTHPKTTEFPYQPNAKLHSELACCLKLGLIDCSNLTLINLRIDNNNKLNLARPCIGCSKLLESLNFKAVFYSDNVGEMQKWKN